VIGRKAPDGSPGMVLIACVPSVGFVVRDVARWFRHRR
jgi:hypothetical protein